MNLYTNTKKWSFEFSYIRWSKTWMESRMWWLEWLSKFLWCCSIASTNKWRLMRRILWEIRLWFQRIPCSNRKLMSTLWCSFGASSNKLYLDRLQERVDWLRFRSLMINWNATFWWDCEWRSKYEHLELFIAFEQMTWGSYAESKIWAWINTGVNDIPEHKMQWNWWAKISNFDYNVTGETVTKYLVLIYVVFRSGCTKQSVAFIFAYELVAPVDEE